MEQHEAGRQEDRVAFAIRVRGLTKRYRNAGREILSDLELEVLKGEIVVIVGVSGAGKSTLLNVLSGMDRDYVGEVEVASANLEELSDAHLSCLRGQTLGFVMQESSLIEGLSVLENVTLPSAFSRRMNRRWKPESQQRALGILEGLGMERLVGERVDELSGGQRQRVCIARALVEDPEILLCDEPTGNLDTDTGAELLAHLRRLRSERGLTVVAVTHESYVAEIADRVLSLEDGRLREAGSGSEDLLK